MFHPCTVTKKCQNYDPNIKDCFMCEQRVRPAKELRGLLPEGLYEPDVQLAIKVVSEFLNNPLINNEGRGQRIDSGEITNEMSRFKKANEILDTFTKIQHIIK